MSSPLYPIPDTASFPRLQLPKITSGFVGNMPLHLVPQNDHGVIVLKLLLYAGDWYASKPGIANLVARMLTKGTSHRDANNLAEIIEYHGAHIYTEATHDLLKISLVTPSVHFAKLLPIFMEVVREPTFPVEAFHKLKKIVHQKIQQAQANPEALVYHKWQSHLFGKNHPYGYVLEKESLEAITPQDLVQHYQTHAWNQCHILLGGDIGSNHASLVEEAFQKISIADEPRLLDHPAQTNPNRKLAIHKSGSHQTAICIGHKSITLYHPDYIPLFLTNRLLGGFFGSYLMRNLREEKGYTYSIYSRIQPLLHDAYWYVATSVKKEHTEEACQEIEKEILRIQNEPIEATAFIAFKNYLTGELLTSFDGLFPIMNRLSNLVSYGLTWNYYETLYDAIQNLEAHTISIMAKKYFDQTRLYQVTVGD